MGRPSRQATANRRTVKGKLRVADGGSFAKCAVETAATEEVVREHFNFVLESFFENDGGDECIDLV